MIRISLLLTLTAAAAAAAAAGGVDLISNSCSKRGGSPVSKSSSLTSLFRKGTWNLVDSSTLLCSRDTGPVSDKRLRCCTIGTMIPRGGGRGRGQKLQQEQSDPPLPNRDNNKQLVLSTSTSTNRQLQLINAKNQNKVSTLYQTKSNAITTRIQSVKNIKRKLKRKEFLTLFMLRIGFVLLFPIAILLLAISLLLSTLLTAVRILTLNLTCRDVSRISYSTSRALLALNLACLTGFLLPYFAMFGLIATTSIAALEMTEPVLRIRYHRQMKKLRHLHKLITDPVLLDTLDIILRSAQTVVVASNRALEQQSKRVAQTGKKPFGLWTRITNTKQQGSKGEQQQQQQREAASHELVETLLQSTGAEKARETFERNVPAPIALWVRDQFSSMRQSGVLEMVASRVIDTLQKDIRGAATFLPYLEAIEQVQRKQQSLLQEEQDKAEKQQQRRSARQDGKSKSFWKL